MTDQVEADENSSPPGNPAPASENNAIETEPTKQPQRPDKMEQDNPHLKGLTRRYLVSARWLIISKMQQEGVF